MTWSNPNTAHFVSIRHGSHFAACNMDLGIERRAGPSAKSPRRLAGYRRVVNAYPGTASYRILSLKNNGA